MLGKVVGWQNVGWLWLTRPKEFSAFSLQDAAVDMTHLLVWRIRSFLLGSASCSCCSLEHLLHFLGLTVFRRWLWMSLAAGRQTGAGLALETLASPLVAGQSDRRFICTVCTLFTQPFSSWSLHRHCFHFQLALVLSGLWGPYGVLCHCCFNMTAFLVQVCC